MVGFLLQMSLFQQQLCHSCIQKIACREVWVKFCSHFLSIFCLLYLKFRTVWITVFKDECVKEFYTWMYFTSRWIASCTKVKFSESSWSCFKHCISFWCENINSNWTWGILKASCFHIKNFACSFRTFRHFFNRFTCP